jgi:hypothetical protein
MAELLEDDMGRIKPQYEKLDGSGYEAWKGKDGHGNVRSDDGQIVALGSTGDADTANTVIGRLKKILAILPTALSAAGLVGVNALEELSKPTVISPDDTNPRGLLPSAFTSSRVWIFVTSSCVNTAGGWSSPSKKTCTSHLKRRSLPSIAVLKLSDTWIMISPLLLYQVKF